MKNLFLFPVLLVFLLTNCSKKQLDLLSPDEKATLQVLGNYEMTQLIEKGITTKLPLNDGKSIYSGNVLISQKTTTSIRVSWTTKAVENGNTRLKTDFVDATVKQNGNIIELYDEIKTKPLLGTLLENKLILVFDTADEFKITAGKL